LRDGRHRLRWQLRRQRGQQLRLSGLRHRLSWRVLHERRGDAGSELRGSRLLRDARDGILRDLHLRRHDCVQDVLLQRRRLRRRKLLLE
jgi:hypothetical protein